jgi:glutamyl-tRNA reductase
MRIAFGRLHGASVAALGVGAMAALVALMLVIRLVTSRSTS